MSQTTRHSSQVYFDIARPDIPIDWAELDAGCGDEIRMVHYKFDRDFLKAKRIGTRLTFAVGPQELKGFRMIERHYFRGKLIKSFDFDFGFGIPNSVNTWENIYEVPSLDARTIQEMMKCPNETISDSFYFVDGNLIMQNKAYFSYI
ncbi:delta subunit of GMP phosphodiesterase [Polychytrium aggregatum]|uniref:delta subunit of GMP phosphodiesterase n=1 Tax=Polychytrium aggregatum TaxID=110093 RepID=UPI0022FDE084|nr:delta subunit of GMP phosphodiesterase [Polychytrium aggregatum]KAI9208042.1 delta subunit of GMP phosphodiesterase [Polychytrium aggregatum]